jgi:hypothetical protein
MHCAYSESSRENKKESNNKRRKVKEGIKESKKARSNR